MSKKKQTKSKASETKQIDTTTQHIKGSILVPISNDVAKMLLCPEFLTSKSITWERTSSKKGQVLKYSIVWETKEGEDYGILKQYYTVSNASSTNTSSSKTPTSSLADEIAKIRALGLDKDTEKTCIDALVKKFST